MSFWAAVKFLLSCPAVLQIGQDVVEGLLNAIAEGRAEDAAARAREAALARARGQAAGEAAHASSASTEGNMRGRR